MSLYHRLCISYIFILFSNIFFVLASGGVADEANEDCIQCDEGCKKCECSE